MSLSNVEKAFLERRATLVAKWPYVGVLLLMLTLGLLAWLVWSKPLFANPYVVWTHLREDAIPVSTLTVMAALLPVVVLLCIALVFVMLVFAFFAFSHEKYYMNIIKARLHAQTTEERCCDKHPSE